MFNKCKRGRREERETVKLAEENRTKWKSGDVIICPCTELLHYNLSLFSVISPHLKHNHTEVHVSVDKTSPSS